MDATRVLEELHDLGFRITEPRRRVIEVVTQWEGPFAADEVYGELRDGGYGVGRATVFRTLDLLVSRRLLDRVHRPDGSHGYVATSSRHCHHLVCSSCGSVLEFHGCNVHDLIDDLAARTRFRVEGHWLELFGTCGDCQQAAG